MNASNICSIDKTEETNCSCDHTLSVNITLIITWVVTFTRTTVINNSNKFELCVHHAATWVGGTFIIGTAETVYDPKLGLIWAVMPLAATLAFTLGKILFLNSRV